MMLPSLRRNRDLDVGPFSGSLFKNMFDDFDDVFSDSVRYTNEEGDMVYEIEAVGFNKDNLSVDVNEGVLTVKGERKIGVEGNYVGKKTIFKRMNIVGSEDVDASITDGILKLVVKAPKKASTKIELK